MLQCQKELEVHEHCLWSWEQSLAQLRQLSVMSPGNALVGGSTVVGALSLIREATIFCFLPKNKLSPFPKFNRGH